MKCSVAKWWINKNNKIPSCILFIRLTYYTNLLLPWILQWETGQRCQKQRCNAASSCLFTHIGITSGYSTLNICDYVNLFLCCVEVPFATWKNVNVFVLHWPLDGVLTLETPTLRRLLVIYLYFIIVYSKYLVNLVKRCRLIKVHSDVLILVGDFHLTLHYKTIFQNINAINTCTRLELK